MTTHEAMEVIDYMVELWPQMQDLKGRKSLSQMWIDTFMPYEFHAAKDALWGYRANQGDPIRPEPGVFKRLMKARCGGVANGVTVVPDIFIQAVDWGPAYEDVLPSKRPALGRWEQLIYTKNAPPSRREMLEDAQKWANRIGEQSGLVYVVVDGVTEQEIRERAHKLHMTGRVESKYANGPLSKRK